MKRILSKRSGFTLIEIVVAFAVFAIMSTMLVSMVQLTLAQRESNMEFQDRIERDAEYLAFHYIGTDDAFDTAETADDTFRLDFGTITYKDGSSVGVDVSIGYQTRSTVSEDEIDGVNYFVADTDYAGLEDVTDGNKEGANPTGGLGQSARYDTRITGSKNLKYIIINKCEKVAGTAATYDIWVKASGEELDTDGDGNVVDGSVPAEDVPYLQYRLIFRSSSTTTVTKTEGGKKYQYTVHPNANIVSFENLSSQYLVMQTGDNILRISAPFGSGKELVGSETVQLRVTFESDPGLDAGSFGQNIDTVDNKVSQGAGAYKYTNFPVLLDDNTPDGDKKNPNIYGAFVYEKVEVPG